MWCVCVKYRSRLWESGIRLVYADMRLANTINITETQWLYHARGTLEKSTMCFGPGTCKDERLLGISSLIIKVATAVENTPTMYDVCGHNALIFDGLQAS